MAHLQQQILDAVKAALIAASTVAGESVFVDRLDTVEPADLPALLVDEGPDGEQIAPGSVGDQVNRTLNVRIRCLLPLAQAHAAEAREFGLQVEKALRTQGARTALIALCSSYSILSSRLEQSVEGDKPYAQRVQDWTFNYTTRRGTPDAKA